MWCECMRFHQIPPKARAIVWKHVKSHRSYSSWIKSVPMHGCTIFINRKYQCYGNLLSNIKCVWHRVMSYILYSDSVGMFVFEEAHMRWIRLWPVLTANYPLWKFLHNWNSDLSDIHILHSILPELTFSVFKDCAIAHWYCLKTSMMRTMPCNFFPRYQTRSFQDLTISQIFSELSALCTSMHCYHSFQIAELL